MASTPQSIALESCSNPCYNLSVGVALNARFTTNGICRKNNTMYTWREQAITEWSHWVKSIVACCHSAKLCAHAARAFRSQQNGAVTKVWRSCYVKPSQKERAIGAVRWKKRGCCCNLSVGVVLNVRFITNGMCGKNNTNVARTSNNRVILLGELCCCLLPQCEALRTCQALPSFQ